MEFNYPGDQFDYLSMELVLLRVFASILRLYITFESLVGHKIFLLLTFWCSFSIRRTVQMCSSIYMFLSPVLDLWIKIGNTWLDFISWHWPWTFIFPFLLWSAEATPKTIMRTMGVKGLTLYHLKSHLQVAHWIYFHDCKNYMFTSCYICKMITAWIAEIQNGETVKQRIQRGLQGW